MSAEFLPNYPEGLMIARDPFEFSHKIHDMAEDGADSFCATFDFDHTMSQGGPNDPSTWEVMDSLLPPTGQEEASHLYDQFYPLQKLGTLTVGQSVEWSSASLELYVKHKVNRAGIKAAADAIQLRNGTAGLLKDLNNGNVPTNILSGGIRDVIDVVNERDGIKTNLITATSLEYDKEGTIVGWDEANMVHALNKYERGNSQLEEIRKKRPHVFLLGDEIQDIEMARGDQGHIMSIRLGDPRKIDSLDLFAKTSFAAGYDMVYIGRSMMPIRILARGLIGLMKS